MQIQKWARHVVFATLAVGALLIALVSVASAVKAPKYQLTVSDDFSSGSIEFVVATVPPVVDAGTYKVGFANNSVAPHVFIAVGGLPEETTIDQFIEVLDAFYAGTPPPEGVFEAGGVSSKPGQDHQKVFDLTEPGLYAFFCPVPSPDGTPHYKEGFVGLFEVVEAP